MVVTLYVVMSACIATYAQGTSHAHSTFTWCEKIEIDDAIKCVYYNIAQDKCIHRVHSHTSLTLIYVSVLIVHASQYMGIFLIQTPMRKR